VRDVEVPAGDLVDATPRSLTGPGPPYTTLVSVSLGVVPTQVLRLLAGLPAPFQRRLTSYGGGPAAMLDAVLLPAPAR
jgi:hypothetical protein